MNFIHNHSLDLFLAISLFNTKFYTCEIPTIKTSMRLLALFIQLLRWDNPERFSNHLGFIIDAKSNSEGALSYRWMSSKRFAIYYEIRKLRQRNGKEFWTAMQYTSLAGNTGHFLKKKELDLKQQKCGSEMRLTILGT